MSEDSYIALKQSEMEFRALSEQAAIGVTKTETATGRYVFVNQRFADIVGYTRDELLTMSSTVLTPPDDLTEELDNLGRLVKGELHEYSLEKRYRRKDGTVVWVSLTVSPLCLEGESSRYLIGVVEDISKRKRIETSVQEAGAMAQRCLSVAAELILCLDALGTITLLNDSGHRLLGYAPGELIGKSWFDTCLPEEMRTEVHGVFAKLMDGEYADVLTYENPVITRNGSRLVLLWHNTLLRDTDGRIVGALSSAEDITGRKAMEEELLRLSAELEQRVLARTRELQAANEGLNDTNEKLQVIREELQRHRREQQIVLDSVPAWIFYKDRENRFILVNQAFADVMGMAKDQLEGKAMIDLYPKDQADAFWIDDKQVMATGRPRRNIVEPVDSPNGTLWVQTDKIPYHDSHGNTIGIIGFALDITERKNAQDALLRSETLLKEMGEMAKVGGWEFDTETMKQVWTEEVYRIHEVDACYKPIVSEGINFYAPWARPIISQAVQHTIEMGEPFDLELEIVTAKNNPRWVRAIGKAHQEKGKTTKVSGTFQDITERKKAEETIRQRTAQLEAANKELEAFSYSVSHDLHSPLRSIDGFSQAFLEDYGATVPPEGREDLERIRRATQRMGQLIDDMLALSRVTRSQMHVEETDMSALAAEVAERLVRENPQRDVELSIEPGMTATGDRQLLIIVLSNLLGNAWKFTSKREHAHVSMGTERDSEHGLAFFVRDDGAGFDPRYKDKLFVAFQRLHSLEEFPGTGIGLATVERVVRRHGGDLWAEGEIDRGATFHFTIPDLYASIPTKGEQQ